jgi:glycosyltransferase involved in cell wall biosynthesis
VRILFLNPGADMGGAETSLTDLLAALRTAHPTWNLHLITGSSGPLTGHAGELGVRTEVLELPTALALAGDSSLREKGGLAGKLASLARGAAVSHGYGRQLARRVRSLRPEIVHATGFKMQVLAALYLAGESKVLWHIHDYVSWRPVVRKVLRATAHRAAGAVANSESVAADLQACCPRLSWTGKLYNAVDAPSLNAQPPHDLDLAAGAEAPPPGTLRIGLVATYARWKGHETYLDALALLPPELPWRAYVVGGPIYKTAGSQFSAAELSEAIARRGLGGRVFLTGFLSGRGRIMRALDIVVHASTKPEPFGMVVVEGMACRKAVIVSEAGGAAELFEEGKTALGHPPGDSLELSKAMERLIRDAALREELGRAGQEFVTSDFSRARLAGDLTQIYGRVVSSLKP